MGFKFGNPPIDLGSNKPFRVPTKLENEEGWKYELLSFQFYTTS